METPSTPLIEDKNNKEEMTVAEAAYLRGERYAGRRLLSLAIDMLGPDGTAESWRAERADLVSFLRRMCADHGDNDWSNDLHVVDVLEKHLFNYLKDLQK